MDPNAPVSLSLAGTPALRRGAEPPSPLAGRDAALLAWLALQGPTPRTRLAALLWPASPPADARNSLRQRLFKLKRQLGAELVVGQATLALSPGVVHDLDAADTLLAGCGDTLPAEIGGEFADWLSREREQRGQRARHALATRADAAEAARDWPAAVAAAQALLALDPLSEAAHRRLMRLHYLAGDRAAALLAFDRCERLLKDEVGTAPDAETLALLATVQAAALPATRALARAVPQVLRPPRLVGRARELAALGAALADGRHAVVVGEAGMGKSRLLAEAREAAGGSVAVSARPGDADQPYAVFGRLVRALREAGHEPPASLRPEFARFVPELGVPAASRFEPAAFERVVAQWLAPPPVPLLVVDDLHFADAASVELLARVAAVGGVPPIAFGARPADGAAALATLERLLGETAGCEQVLLAPLTEAELVELVDSLQLDGVAGDALAPRLRRHTGGNPQFVLETLRTLLIEGGGQVPAAGVLPVPAGVGAVIERRLKRLSAPALKLARVAAVAAGDFSVPLAAAVLGCDVLDLADAWAELESAQVLADHGFAHDLVFEAVRAGLPRPIARVLHAGVAGQLERQGGAAAAVAQHWLAAGDGERAVPALERAAASAEAASRLREAAELHTTLARLHGEAGRARERQAAALRAFIVRVEVDEDPAWADATLDALEASARGDAELAAVLEQRARVAATRWDIDAGEAVARRAIDAARRAGEPAIECDSRVVLAQLLLKKRRPDEAAAVLAGAQAFVESGAALEQRFMYEQCMAWLALEQERFTQAQRQWIRCAELAAEQGSMTNVAVALGYQMLSLGYLGRFGDAADAGERQRALMLEYRLYGDPYPLIDLNLAHVYVAAGRLADALAALARAEALPAVHRPSLELRRAAVYAALGQPGRARPFAQRAFDESQHDSQQLQPLLALLRIDHALHPDAGLDAAARERLRELDRLAAQSPKALPWVRTRLAEAECSRGEARVAAADAALSRLAGGEMYGLQVVAHARRAQGLLESGRVGAAREAVRTQLALSEAYGPETMSAGEAGLIAARVLREAGDPAAAGVLRAASDWLHRTLAHQVPAEFRESFVHRVPAHRELAALANQLAALPAPATAGRLAAS